MRIKLQRKFQVDGRASIPFAALLAIVPLVVQGSSCGHDFDFHLLNWLEASIQFAHLTFPQWAYTPAFNAGEPRFIFYPPLSWTLGALLGFVLPWTLVPAAFTWIALTLSGLTFHSLARRYTSAGAATFAAILYLANPYMLFTAYERTAFAELLAASWLPLLFAAALAPRIRMLPLACALALIWLTNAPAAVMSTYALAFLTLVRLALLIRFLPSSQKRGASSQLPLPSISLSERPGTGSIHSHSPNKKVDSESPLHLALTTIAGTTLGLTLAAFYILPAAYERRFVQIQMLATEGMRISDHFLFHHMPGTTPDDRFHDAVVRTASFIAITLFVFIVAVFLAVLSQSSPKAEQQTTSSFGAGTTLNASRSKLREAFRSAAELRHLQTSFPIFQSTLFPIALLALAIVFLLTPVSLPVWTHLPDLAFLQFPWRLTALLGLILAVLTALAINRLSVPSRGLTAVASVFLAGLLITPAWFLFHQTCEVQDAVPARVALFHSAFGTEATDEYTPLDADPDALRPHDPPYWFISATSDVNAPAPAGTNPGPAANHLNLILNTPAYLVLNRRQYPNWQVHLNHTLIQPATPEREDGLMTLLLPAGPATIDLTLTRTPDQTAGLLISIAALLFVLMFALRNLSDARRRRSS